MPESNHMFGKSSGDTPDFYYYNYLMNKKNHTSNRLISNLPFNFFVNQNGCLNIFRAEAHHGQILEEKNIFSFTWNYLKNLY